jgi:hypothetical protein
VNVESVPYKLYPFLTSPFNANPNFAGVTTEGKEEQRRNRSLPIAVSGPFPAKEEIERVNKERGRRVTSRYSPPPFPFKLVRQEEKEQEEMFKEQEEEHTPYNPPPSPPFPSHHSTEEDSLISKEEKEVALIPYRFR